MNLEDGDTIQPMMFSLTTSAGQGSAGQFWLRVHHAVLVRWGLEKLGTDRPPGLLQVVCPRGRAWVCWAVGLRNGRVGIQHTDPHDELADAQSGGSITSASLCWLQVTSCTGLSRVPPKSMSMRNLRMSPYLE